VDEKWQIVMPYRDEFREVLSLLLSAIRAFEEQGFRAPILVGGAAVELYTGGAVVSGDFDLVEVDQAEFERTLAGFGFEKASGPGALALGMVHPRLNFGIQVVSGLLMDGKADREKIRLFQNDAGAISVIPVEDLIADRMGQAFSDNPPRKDMLDQAVKILELAAAIDETYLNRRICEETDGGANLALLRDLS
jgi:hypothetical protein